MCAAATSRPTPASWSNRVAVAAAVARRLATLTGFYRYAVQEGTLPHSPVAHVRRPSVARDSQTLGLDREEAVRFLAAAQAASTRDHALACLLTLKRVARIRSVRG